MYFLLSLLAVTRYTIYNQLFIYKNVTDDSKKYILISV